MLFKLSIKNIKKSFKDYAIYFLTIVLGVAIFYVFNAIGSQTVMLNITSSKQSIVELMISMLDGVSIVVSFILGFLIIYASRFLIKKRNKEFGIYMTLGMGKEKISKILLIETFLIGLISLIVGLLVGVFASQAMSLFVAAMFEADLKNFAFTFSKTAFLKTCIYFGITYLIVMLFNVVSISKCKLIDLLTAHKKSEKITLKNLGLSTVLFVISCLILGTAYYLVTDGIHLLSSFDKILIPILMGIFGTFLLFYSLSGLILRVCMNLKKMYYRGLNSFTVRQISSKITTTVFSVSLISLMLFVTICVLSASLSIKNSMSKNLAELAPIDIQFIELKEIRPTDDLEITEVKTSPIENTLKKIGIDLTKYEDVNILSIYQREDLTIKDTLGSAFPNIKENYEHLEYGKKEDLIKLSDYNKIAKMFGRDELELEDDEYIIIADFSSWAEIRNTALKMGTTIKMDGKDYRPKETKCIDSTIFIEAAQSNTGMIIFPDEALLGSSPSTEVYSANYAAKDKESKKEIEKELKKLEESKYRRFISINSKISITENSVGLGALVTFIGLYLGIIFLISSAAILALKELSESSDNKERYMMLRKIGADEKMLNRALRNQIAIFFTFPLIVAIIHSVFGIKFSILLLETFGKRGLLTSIITTGIVIILIYGGYFLITYYTSKRIIKDR